MVRAEPDIVSLDYDRTPEQQALTKDWKPVIKVAVSGAAGQICNHLLFMLASGEVYGRDQPIELRLLGSERSKGALEGVAMELEDSLYPLLSSVRIGIEPEKVFEDADWALLVGAKPRGPGMERSDLLDLNGQVFEAQGKALDQVTLRSPCPRFLDSNLIKRCDEVGVGAFSGLRRWRAKLLYTRSTPRLHVHFLTSAFTLFDGSLAILSFQA